MPPDAAHIKNLEISIITVVKNPLKERKEFLEQCISSVHNMEDVLFEHIIIDGNSHDGTVAFLDQYAQKGWIKYISEPDSGVYEAMNKGMNMAAGKYIIFLNCDDFFHNSKYLRHCIDILEETRADACASPIRFVQKDGTVKINGHPKWMQVFRKMPVCHQALVMRTDCLRALGGFDTQFRVQADYDLLLRFALSGMKFKALEELSGCTFRYGGISTTTSQESLYAEKVGIYKKNYEKYGATTKTCIKIADYEYIPANIFNKLMEHINQEHIEIFFKEQKKSLCRLLRRKLFCVRIKRDMRTFRILGITFIDSRFKSVSGLNALP